SAGRPCPAGTRYSSANTYAATTRASRSVISSSNLEGTQVWKPFLVKPRVPAEPAQLSHQASSGKALQCSDTWWGYSRGGRWIGNRGRSSGSAGRLVVD